MVDTENNEAALFPERVGDRLRAARIKAGFDLSDIATKTRVPLRHLEGIESGDYSQLPSPTYCVGFVKAYARAVGENEVDLARDIRTELDLVTPEQRAFVEYEISDPARLPSRTLAWTAAAIMLLIVIGYVIWRSQMANDPRDAEPVAVEAAQNDEASLQPTAPPAQIMPTNGPASGPVTLTALKPVWVKIYEADGKRIFEKEMAIGEIFTLPAQAIRPQILTGRPEALRVAVGGKEVAALGPPERTVSDLDISAAALTSRTLPPNTGTGAPNTGPSSAP